MTKSHSSELAACVAELQELFALVTETPTRGSDAEARKPSVVAALRTFADTYDTAPTPRISELARDAISIAEMLAMEDLHSLCNVADEDGSDPSSFGPMHSVHRFHVSALEALREAQHS